MKQSRAAHRYASALFQVAKDKSNLEAVNDDVKRISAVIAETPRVMDFLGNPAIHADKKKGVMEAAFKDATASVTFNFLMLIIDKGREGELDSIADAFVALYNDFHGIAPITVTSAVELSEEQKTQLLAKAHEYCGKKVTASYVIDPSLLGGFTVRIADTVLDGSLRHQLELLAKRLNIGVSVN